MKTKEKLKNFCIKHEKEIKTGLLIVGIGIGATCLGYKLGKKYFKPTLMTTVTNKEIQTYVEPLAEKTIAENKTVEKIGHSVVKAFPRKLQEGYKASAKQIALAKENGVYLEPGYTYVTEFDRRIHYYS